MPHHGSDGIVKVGANTVAEVQGWTYDETDVSLTSYASMGASSVTYKSAGIIEGSGTIECIWDETDATGQGGLAVGTEVTLHLMPEGDTTGDTEYTGTVVIDSRGLAGSTTAMNTQKFTFKGTLTEATVS